MDQIYWVQIEDEYYLSTNLDTVLNIINQHYGKNWTKDDYVQGYYENEFEIKEEFEPGRYVFAIYAIVDVDDAKPGQLKRGDTVYVNDITEMNEARVNEVDDEDESFIDPIILV